MILETISKILYWKNSLIILCTYLIRILSTVNYYTQYNMSFIQFEKNLQY